MTGAKVARRRVAPRKAPDAMVEAAVVDVDVEAIETPDAPADDPYGLPPATPETDALIIENMNLARHYARRMALKTKFSADDLQYAATWGLVKAARTFDESRGFKFSTHAVPKIVGTIKQWIRDYGYSVKFPHTWREHLPKVRRLAQSGKSSAEIVAEIGNRISGRPILTEDEVRRMLHDTRTFKHWDEVLGLDSEPRVRNATALEDQEFEDGDELNGLYDLATRAWQRLDPGDRRAIADGWSAKRRHVPGLPLGQFAVAIKRVVGQYEVNAETELAPLGFPLECGLAAAKPSRRMVTAAGKEGEQVAEIMDQLGLSL